MHSNSTPAAGAPKRQDIKRRFTFPVRLGGGRGIDEPTLVPNVRKKRTRKRATLPRHYSRFRKVFWAVRVGVRFRKFLRTVGYPSQ